MDGQMDRQTDRFAIAYSVLSMLLHAKNSTSRYNWYTHVPLPLQWTQQLHGIYRLSSLTTRIDCGYCYYYIWLNLFSSHAKCLLFMAARQLCCWQAEDIYFLSLFFRNLITLSRHMLSMVTRFYKMSNNFTTWSQISLEWNKLLSNGKWHCKLW